MGIEFSYAAETAFVSPTLLKIGVDHQHMTLVWALSPLVGFFVTPILGSMSDRCKLKYGRRRPFILLLALGVFIGKSQASSCLFILSDMIFFIFFHSIATILIYSFNVVYIWTSKEMSEFLHFCRSHLGAKWWTHRLCLRRYFGPYKRNDPTRTSHNGEATWGGNARIRRKSFLAFLGHLLHYSRHSAARLWRRRLSKSSEGIPSWCHCTWWVKKMYTTSALKNKLIVFMWILNFFFIYINCDYKWICNWNNS